MTPLELTAWLILTFGGGTISLLTMVWLARQVYLSFFPPPVTGQEFVTKHEFEKEIQELKADQKDLRHYITDAFHRQGTALTTLLARTAVIEVFVLGKRVVKEEEHNIQGGV